MVTALMGRFPRFSIVITRTPAPEPLGTVNDPLTATGPEPEEAFSTKVDVVVAVVVSSTISVLVEVLTKVVVLVLVLVVVLTLVLILVLTLVLTEVLVAVVVDTEVIVVVAGLRSDAIDGIAKATTPPISRPMIRAEATVEDTATRNALKHRLLPIKVQAPGELAACE